MNLKSKIESILTETEGSIATLLTHGDSPSVRTHFIAIYNAIISTKYEFATSQVIPNLSRLIEGIPIDQSMIKNIKEIFKADNKEIVRAIKTLRDTYPMSLLTAKNICDILKAEVLRGE